MIPVILALYANMAPVDQYMMPRNAEIALARSAAPRSVSDKATVLVLGPHGYYAAIEGSNGFACYVERSWNAEFDWSEYWNPKVRAADCLNPAAARSILPVSEMKAKLFLAGETKAAVVAAVKEAYAEKRLPSLEPGAMSFMMSRSSYLTDKGVHDMPHVMFFMPFADAAPWGSDVPLSPIQSTSLWFGSPDDAALLQGLPPIRVFIVGLTKWSDGSSAGDAWEHMGRGSSTRT